MVRIIILAAFIILCLNEINAQDNGNRKVDVQAGRVGFGPQLGYFKAGDADKGSVMGGVFIRGRLIEQFGFDLSVNYRKEEYASGRIEVTQWPVQLSGLFYPIPSVYGLIGIGMYFTSFTFNSQSVVDLPNSTASRFGFHFGAGIEPEISPRFKIIGDIKYVLLGYGLNDFGTIKASDINANFFVINVGLVYML